MPTVRQLREFLERCDEQDAQVMIEDRTGSGVGGDGVLRRLRLNTLIWHDDERCYSLGIDGDLD